MSDRALVLASRSPRRLELLARLGLTCEVRVEAADIDETPLPDEDPADLAHRLALAKAEVVAERDHWTSIVIGADTVVALDGRSYGQPVDAAEATSMLRDLRGRWHHVHTAVCVLTDNGDFSGAVTTSTVHMSAMSAEEIAWYVATGEPFDKAGAYALQGIGGVFVERVEGSVSGVIGLPLSETAELLRAAGLTVAGGSTR